MDDIRINIPVSAADPRAKWEDNVTRFCFAAARLPAPVIEGFLELLEAYEDAGNLTSNGEYGHA